MQKKKKTSDKKIYFEIRCDFILYPQREENNVVISAQMLKVMISLKKILHHTP
jgi:hypothetical protein